MCSTCGVMVYSVWCIICVMRGVSGIYVVSVVVCSTCGVMVYSVWCIVCVMRGVCGIYVVSGGEYMWCYGV